MTNPVKVMKWADGTVAVHFAPDDTNADVAAAIREAADEAIPHDGLKAVAESGNRVALQWVKTGTPEQKGMVFGWTSEPTYVEAGLWVVLYPGRGLPSRQRSGSYAHHRREVYDEYMFKRSFVVTD